MDNASERYSKEIAKKHFLVEMEEHDSRWRKYTWIGLFVGVAGILIPNLYIGAIVFFYLALIEFMLKEKARDRILLLDIVPRNKAKEIRKTL